jgi:RNA polymerase sigma factor (sigma-70 family)
MCIIVDQIMAGEEAGPVALYNRVYRGPCRYFLRLNIRNHEAVEDAMHDVFAIALKEIQKGALRNPEALNPFLRTLCRRKLIEFIDHAAKMRRNEGEAASHLMLENENNNPEAVLLKHENEALVRAALDTLTALENQVLTRFYLREESRDSIMARYKMSETSFRLLKTRAKAKFGIAARKFMEAQQLSILVRLGTRSLV